MSALIESKQTQPPRSDVRYGAQDVKLIHHGSQRILATLHQSSHTNLLLHLRLCYFNEWPDRFVTMIGGFKSYPEHAHCNENFVRVFD
jgi:hypothetical protein